MWGLGLGFTVGLGFRAYGLGFRVGLGVWGLRVVCLHQDDKSFELLDLSCRKTSCVAAECPEARVAGLAEYFILRVEINPKHYLDPPTTS